MFDDGAHCDFFAADSIYGTTIYSVGDILQYYFYAQNDSAGRFLPERAAYELFTVHPQISDGKVVLNELKMVGDGENADQDSETEPWLELYNNSKENIQLKDLKVFYPSEYFQDNEVLFTFPDTLMAPQSYLIVWIDGDSTQSGLHSVAPMCGSGTLSLGYDSVQLIDAFAFGFQSGELSFGSCPNGSTSRGFLIPTFAAKNYQLVSDSGHMILYPNPAADKINIVIAPSNGLEYIEIINSQMQHIMFVSHESDVNLIRPAEYASVDVSSLTPGIYFATIHSSGRTETVRFIVAR